MFELPKLLSSCEGTVHMPIYGSDTTAQTCENLGQKVHILIRAQPEYCNATIVESAVVSLLCFTCNTCVIVNAP